MTLKELETQLLALTPEEKAQAIQILTQTLTSNHEDKPKCLKNYLM